MSSPGFRTAAGALLCHVLAARLPGVGFLPVRVVLPDIPTDYEVQDQIEHAIRFPTSCTASKEVITHTAYIGWMTIRRRPMITGTLVVVTASQEASAPFSRIKVRVGALVFCGNDIALIRRDRPTSVHYTPPGGNLEAGEGLVAGLMRELDEELGLAPSQSTTPELLWVVDQMVTRPGRTPPPRKLHLIYRLHITTEIRAGLATEEYDELDGGGHEIGHVEWVDYRATAGLPIFPPIGAALAVLPTPFSPQASATLPAVTDDNYSWV